MNAVEHPAARSRAADGRELVDAWTSTHGDRIVVHMAKGAIFCDALVGPLLDAAAPLSPDPAGGLRPSRCYLLDGDGRDHIVLVATKLVGGRPTLPVALARCVRIGSSRVARPAVVVSPAFRGRGIGTRLLTRLSAVARARGVDSFRVDVTGADTAALRLLHHVGLHPAAVMHGLQPTIDVPLSCAT